jgi:glycosyltransferase involved in cell wall biosynthesis
LAIRRIGVLHVVHSLHVGGAEKLVFDLARRTDPAQFAVSVACLDEAGTLAERLSALGIPVVVVGRRPGLDGRVVLRLRQLIARHGIDVVHAHQYTPFFYGVAAARSAGAACVFTEHGRHHPDVRKPRRVAANVLLSRLPRATVAVSEFTRRALIENDGFPPDRVVVLYNGVDLPDGPAVERTEARIRLGLPIGVPIVGFCGRLSPEKNIPLLLEAFARLRTSHEAAHLVIAGDGPDRMALESRVSALGLGASVRFTGFVSDVPLLMAALDVFTLASVTEGTSVTLLEAMAAGRPAVVTRVGGNPEIVVDGRTGHLVPSGDALGLATRLADVLGNPDAAAELGAAGRRRVLENFTFEGMVRAYEALYRPDGPPGRARGDADVGAR